MEFNEFLMRVAVLGFGVTFLNTYREKGETRCFLLISEIGDTGVFFKMECSIRMFDFELASFYRKVVTYRKRHKLKKS